MKRFWLTNLLMFCCVYMFGHTLYNSFTDGNFIRGANNYVDVAPSQTAEINAIEGSDTSQIHLTAYPINTPIITVSPMVVDSFYSLPNIPSAAKSYVIEGSSLNSHIVITTPFMSNFEASLSNSPFSPTSTIYLSPVNGIVAPTTIYVRLKSSEIGLVGDFIEHNSTGAEAKNVLCLGKVLAFPPTVSSTISFGAVTNNSIVVNFSGGNGDSRLLLVKESTPVDAIPPNGNYYGPQVFGTGTPLGNGNYPVYRGFGNSTTVTGLTAGNTYHFEIFEYNTDYNGNTGFGAENYLSPGGVGNTAPAYNPVSYNWVGGNSTWATSSNWSPARISPASNDILIFSSGGIDTISNVPNISIAQLHVSSSTKAILRAAVSATVLTINGSVAGDDLTVEAGSELLIAGPNSSYKLDLATGNTAAIDGKMTLKSGTINFSIPQAKKISKQ